jgi:hypothetical protein
MYRSYGAVYTFILSFIEELKNYAKLSGHFRRRLA